jgi:phage-related protein (TIGR01555 family)
MKFPWFKKQDAVLPAITKPLPRNSFFSTEINNIDLANMDWDAVLRQSFQVLPNQFKAIDREGVTVDGDKYKVSVAAPGMSHAMDDASAGNVLSMNKIVLPINTVPQAQLAWYASKGFVGYQICGMLAQHWFIDKVCTVPARDAMRHGYELATDDETEIDPKVLSFIRKKDKQFGIKQNCVEFVKFNRVFGIRIALPIIDTQDPNYYLLPFDIDTVKPGTYRGIAQIDPYWITPELDMQAAANPASIHFYEPTWWRVNGKRIHRSHLVIIRNGQVVDVLKPTYYYGGIPIPQKIAERVYAAERTANEAPQLALTKRTTFMKVDITQAMANLTGFLQKINFFAEMRDNYGVKIGGLEDEMEQFDTTLSDFDEVTMTQYTIACAASDCPTTKIMGTSPKGGLGSEGDYDADSYHEFLESLQMNDMQPLLERHHLLLLASEVRPKFGSKVPVDWEPVIKWNPCDTPDAKEQAEINEIKSRVGNNLVNSGAIDGVDERNRLMSDKDSGYDGLGDREPEPMDLSGEVDETGGIESDKSQSGEKS